MGKIVALAGLIAIGSMLMTPALAHYRSYRWYPVACHAVVFPRSPLCAGIPLAYDPYFPYR